MAQAAYYPPGAGSVAPLAHVTSHITGGSDPFTSAQSIEARAKRILETSGPSALAFGAIADGEYLKRSGATVISGPAGSSSSPLNLIASAAVSYNLVAGESGSVCINPTGSTVHYVLPAIAKGLTFTFIQNDSAFFLDVFAGAGDFIRTPIGPTVAGNYPTAGYIRSPRKGSVCYVVAIEPDPVGAPGVLLWSARLDGNWTIDNATGAALAFTSTDLVAFTPTGGVTNCTYTGWYQQNGRLLDLFYHLKMTGIPAAGQIYVNMPAGISVAATLLGSPYNGCVGVGSYDAVPTTGAPGQIMLQYLTSVPDKFYGYTPGGVAIDGTAFGNTWEIDLHVTVPIV